MNDKYEELRKQLDNGHLEYGFYVLVLELLLDIRDLLIKILAK